MTPFRDIFFSICVDRVLLKRIYSVSLVEDNLMKRTPAPRKSTALIRDRATGFSDEDLAELEQAHPSGLSTQEVVERVASRGERLSEATFRKYVQLGLLPRSVRVGRKGKHKGSQGLYPVTVVRQIELIRRLMAQGFTIEEIQREFLFVRGDIEALGRQLARVFDALDSAVAEHPGDELADRGLEEARLLATSLVAKLEAVERRLSMQARMARAVV